MHRYVRVRRSVRPERGTTTNTPPPLPSARMLVRSVATPVRTHAPSCIESSARARARLDRSMCNAFMTFCQRSEINNAFVVVVCVCVRMPPSGLRMLCNCCAHGVRVALPAPGRANTHAVRHTCTHTPHSQHRAICQPAKPLNTRRTVRNGSGLLHSIYISRTLSEYRSVGEKR